MYRPGAVSVVLDLGGACVGAGVKGEGTAGDGQLHTRGLGQEPHLAVSAAGDDAGGGSGYSGIAGLEKDGDLLADGARVHGKAAG